MSLDLLALVARFNRAADGTMVVPDEYIEIVVTRADAREARRCPDALAGRTAP